MSISINLSKNSWESIIRAIPDPKNLLETFKCSVKYRTNYEPNGNDYYGSVCRSYHLEFQNEKSYTHFILKYGDLIRTSVD